ncbi:MAG: hypothetical protein LBU53_06110 [Zoogloeaceae bacterium]|nr:hypothetical protein [Zoogloeaceae bacterium]
MASFKDDIVSDFASLIKSILYGCWFVFSTDYAKREVKMASFKDGIVFDGSRKVGNVKDGIIRDGASLGSGKALGNVKDDVVRDGSTKGSGRVLFNVKNGTVREDNGWGRGRSIGKTSSFAIKGMERELDATIVAAYHFLVKKII